MAVLLGPASAQAQAGIPDLVGLLLHTIGPKRIGAPVAGSGPVPGDTAVVTAGATRTNDPGSAALFDIAGVRIGMTVAEATAAMQKFGYTVSSTTTTLSFEQEVAIKVAQRRNEGFADGPRKSPSTIKATTKLGAGLTVGYAQWPGGARVDYIEYYDGTPSRPETSAFLAQLVGKYGHWSRNSATDPTWCSAGDAVCAALGTPKLASIQSNLSSANHVWMKPGSDAGHRMDRLIDAEVDRLAPKAERSAL